MNVPPFDVLADLGMDGFLAGGVHRPHDEVAAALRHADDDRLVLHLEAATLARDPAAEIGFVYFDVAAQRIAAINLGHVFPQLMAHAPRGFVGDAELAL